MRLGPGGDVDDCFGAADVFEAVVGADGDGVFAGRERLGEREFVALFERIADGADWGDHDPVAAVDAVLGAIDGAGCVARGEFKCSSALRCG